MWLGRHAARGCHCMSDTAATSPQVSPLLLSLLLPLLAFAPIQVGWAQDTTVATGTISGVVQDQTTGAPLSGAQVRVVGTRLSIDAGLDGRYTLASVRPGTYRVQAQRIGYGLLETTVEVASGQTASADFRLQQLAVACLERGAQRLVAANHLVQARLENRHHERT